MHTNLDIKEPLFSSNKEVGYFSAVFHWCKKANLMRPTELRPTEVVPGAVEG
jgi:hypothetical protein